MASASNVNFKGSGITVEWDSKNFNPILVLPDLPVQLAEREEEKSGYRKVKVKFSTGDKGAWI